MHAVLRALCCATPSSLAHCPLCSTNHLPACPARCLCLPLCLPITVAPTTSPSLCVTIPIYLVSLAVAGPPSPNHHPSSSTVYPRNLVSTASRHTHTPAITITATTAAIASTYFKTFPVHTLARAAATVAHGRTLLQHTLHDFDLLLLFILYVILLFAGAPDLSFPLNAKHGPHALGLCI